MTDVVAGLATAVLQGLKDIRPLPLKSDGELAQVMERQEEGQPGKERLLVQIQALRQETAQPLMVFEISLPDGSNVQAMIR
jgi:hypothetical protein